MPRSTARHEVQRYMGDTGMMDFMLKAVANHQVGPWVVFRYALLTAASSIIKAMLQVLPVLTYKMDKAMPLAVSVNDINVMGNLRCL